MKKFVLGVAALGGLLMAPGLASAAVQGYAIANVNMRSGPSTAYPAVTVVPVGAPVTINGCMSSVNWCDVSFVGGRGWVSGNYVQASYRSNRVYVAPDYYQGLGIPTVTFQVDNYWDRYYRGRDFYRERDRWRRYDWHADRPLPPPPRPPRWDDNRPPPPPPGWNRDRDGDRWGRGPDRDRDRDRWDRDDRRPPPPGPGWDRDRNDRDRDRDRPRDRDRDHDRNDRGPDRRPDADRGNDRGPDRRPPPRPPQQQQDGQRTRDNGDQQRQWGGMRGNNGVVCVGSPRDCN